MAPIGGHEIFGLDSTDCECVLVPFLRHPSRRRFAPAEARQKLGRFSVKMGRFRISSITMASASRRFIKASLGHFADATDASPGPRERMSPDNIFWQNRVADPIGEPQSLKQISQWLDQIKAQHVW